MPYNLPPIKLDQSAIKPYKLKNNWHSTPLLMEPLMRSWKLLFLSLLASTVCFAAQPDRITGPIDSSQKATLPGRIHRDATPQNDQGPVDPSFQFGYVTLVISPSASQQTQLDRLLAQQQDPKSPNYHKWLSPQQYADRFGLSQNDITKITTWLGSEGFQILNVGGGRNSVAFSGTAAQVQQAFGSEIHNYNVNGKKHFANSTALTIPSVLSGVVTGVIGLHSFGPHPTSRGKRLTGARNSHRDYYDGDFVFPNFVAPGDFATIYDINPFYNASTPIDGTGQTLAIIGETDIYLADINDFRAGFNLNQISGCTLNASGVITACDSTYFKYVAVGADPGAPYACGDLGEADLDIEWSGAIARNAQVIFVNSPVTYDSECNPTNSAGVNTALIAAINPPSGPPIAPVMSMSYGICEAEAEDLETYLQEGNSEGVTIMNSADDIGSAGCDYSPPNKAIDPPFSPAEFGLAVSYPASSPEVTGVGGTSITLANDSYPSPATSYWGTSPNAYGGTAISYIPEIPWNDDEELATYCHAPADGDTFCSTGGGEHGWVALSTSATAAQVQTDIWIAIGGGGASNCWTEDGDVCEAGFARPAFQNGLSVASAPAGVRYVPDVSLLASPDFPGYVFCTPQNFPTSTASSCASGIFTAVQDNESIVGGTSASSPTFAAIVTLLNQYLVANGLQSTPGLGNINQMLYTLAASPSNNYFHQVTTGDNKVYCQPNTPAGQPATVQCPAGGVIGYLASDFDAKTGYNLVTGLGSVDVSNLAAAWKSYLKPDFALSADTLTPTSISAGQSASSSVTIAPVSGSSPMTVNFAPSSCTGLPSGAACAFSPTSVYFDGTDPVTTTLTISTSANMAASGPTTITIVPLNSSNTTATVSLTVSVTNESFTLTPNANTYPVAVGGTASVSIAVNGTNGFIVGSGAGATTALPLTYSCVGSSSTGTSLSAAEIQCQLPSLGQPTYSTAVTVGFVTTAPTAQLRPPLMRHSQVFYALLLPGLFGIVFASGSRRRGLRLLSLIVVLGFSTLGLGSCSSGGSNTTPPNPGTPVGSYAVTINATTGGANPLTYSMPITLNVTAQ
jgi:subtilase family serine protease